jgi:metal-responsive CopG/Arc/MetJ family transcriptional regulator
VQAVKNKAVEVPVSFKLNSDLVRDIDEISQREFRSRTATVRLALVDFVQNRKTSAQKGAQRNAK